MQKQLLLSKHFLQISWRYYSSHSISRILQPSTSSSYWSLLQNQSFTFNDQSSKSALNDPYFMQQLFTTTHLVSHSYDLYQCLDMPSQLIYLDYLNKNDAQTTQQFLQQLSQLPSGMKRLIDFRASLLSLLHHYPNQQSTLSPLESKLKSIIKEKRSSLMIKRITWQPSATEIIEKLCQYEAVHAVTSSQDIKRRLASDRRVYGLFMKGMSNEPLVFVHVALVSDLSNSIQTLLNAPIHTHSFRHAICYSITTQKGLGGIHLGNYLIREVISQLQHSFPHLDTFATLSPIPGFRSWLMEHPQLKKRLIQLGGLHWEKNLFNMPKTSPLSIELLRLCARYILKEKRSNKGALDPVANFHLRNGACAHQLQWMGDISDKGLQESFGIMINYKYIPNKLDDHHQHYINHGTIFVSEQEKSWLSEWLGSDVVSIDCIP
ncbi:malonyl-CoA decarboxylase-domain-containing protein [Halteromyces radiatus]|uniref:malonyl-CoA decarboxylase-domain-containing protein n=1 Tax=Halteromyces radiatus TaxID=101107 RepID=UPI0022211513|nr:malonyl-CoA decarboxylase-domain-containing protein [Halteromyces radiatus]KAI8093860.1 malonyl-CoA decarboxylase-domain-containing protein [Halteromyces radiatus]